MHLAKSLSKGIHVDFVIKYNAKWPAKDFDDIEVVDGMDSDENDIPTPKRPRKVVHAPISIIDFVDCYDSVVGWNKGSNGS